MQLSTAVVSAVMVACMASAASAERVVAIMPLSTLGSEDKSAATKKLLLQIEQAFAGLPDTKIIRAVTVNAAIDKAKKPQLKQCEGDTSCLAEVGKLVGAQYVVTGEVGGLGDSRVVYLKSTDVAARRELRSTTLAVGTDDPAGAAIRLLDPDRYRGTVKFGFDVQGANVQVNGTRVRLSPTKELALPVGTHAVTVTHPQYHNFVKFVDVGFGKTTSVDVTMKQYPIIQHDIQGKPTSRDTIEYIDPPLWRRPYVTGPAIVVLAVAAGFIAAALSNDGPDLNNCRKIGGEGC